MKRKYKKFGLTLVELLAVLAIIALLTAILIPSLNLARNSAKKARQSAQLAIIDQALMAFRGDYGDYPPSFLNDSVAGNYYCGAQKLSEALLGWDLLGFHPDSDFRALGDVADLGVYDGDEDVDQTNLDRRVGPYLELETANVFKLGELWPTGTGQLAPDTFVICDSFKIRRVTLASGQTVNAGTPILYYRANTTSKVITFGQEQNRIYNRFDNIDLAILNDQASVQSSKLADRTFFYSDEFIIDPRVAARPWPYRADSYILVSAGADGLYGTRDDVRNFGN